MLPSILLPPAIKHFLHASAFFLNSRSLRERGHCRRHCCRRHYYRHC
ncbi:MAG: hypothetical protein FWE54_04135 [Methanimicrococcus sp.]|nr:hypothetical protein [Methanimicrococcus sp.]